MYATVIDRKLETHIGVPSLEKMQEVVGGYIETALRCPSPSRKNVTADVYVNEEGLLIDLPINHVRWTDGSLIAGNLIIVATDEKTGETIPLREEELNEVMQWMKLLPENKVPNKKA